MAEGSYWHIAAIVGWIWMGGQPVTLVGVTGRFVQNCTLSCLGQERGVNIA
jgi:hypothetical protein